MDASGIAEAALFEQGKYLEPGKYVLQINKIIEKKLRNNKGAAYIAECTVVESSDLKNHPVGSKASWYQDLGVDAAWGAIKEFAYATLGLKWPDQKDQCLALNEKGPDGKPLIQKLVEESVEQNAWKGRRVGVETYHKTTKERKVTFTVHRWEPVAQAA